jgi:hypothetical protein
MNCIRRRFGARESKNALVLVRKDLDETRLRVSPVLENPSRARAAGQVAMAFEQASYAVNVLS